MCLMLRWAHFLGKIHVSFKIEIVRINKQIVTLFWDLSFYYHILTGNYEFEIPETFSNDGTNFIPEKIVNKTMQSRDEFTSGHKIVPAGGKVDETAEQCLFERETGFDKRELVSISKKEDNFVVVLEGLHNGQMSLGSGVLARG